MLKNATQLNQEEANKLAPYAMKSSQSLGRVFNEHEDPMRLPFQRDRDRIIHCKAFRRLQAKTQVFVSYFGDHYRDRLTHTMEMSQIGRDIARTLGLNEDLTEAVALAHDLGHPPFGHGGEAALNEMMQQHGLMFEHNEQSRRIVEKLEKPFPNFDGLNLTKETLDGMLKHDESNHLALLQFKTSAHLESQVADLADEIAYINHDIDDGLRSGIITFQQIRKFELWQEAESAVVEKYGKLIQSPHDPDRLRSRVVARIIANMIEDLCLTTNANLTQNHIKSVEDVRNSSARLVGLSQIMRAKVQLIRQFLFSEFYLSPQVETKIDQGKEIIKNLFRHYLNHLDELPEIYQQMIKDGERQEVVIKDYIAGMTDHFAESTAQAKFNSN